MTDLPGYDAWKTQTPPDWNPPPLCDECHDEPAGCPACNPDDFVKCRDCDTYSCGCAARENV